MIRMCDADFDADYENYEDEDEEENYVDTNDDE